MKYIKYFLITAAVALPATLINITHAAYANSVTWFNIITTLFYLVFWLLFGYNSGTKKATSFLAYIIVLWSLTLGITIFHNSYQYIQSYYLIPVVTSFTPMYGLYYYIDRLTSVSQLVKYCILMVPPFIIAMLGYVLGIMRIKQEADNKH